jgi:hypothetical protein
MRAFVLRTTEEHVRTGPKRLGVAALALTAVLLLAGCNAISGLTGGAADPASMVLTAADKTTEAGSSRFAVTSTNTGAGEGFDLSGEGVFDYAGQRGSISMNIPGFGQTTTLIDGNVVYQQIPEEQAAQLGGTWMRFDMSGLPGAEQGGLSSGNSDPSAAMEWLKGASEDITEVGQEDVRGDATTHYRVTLDLQKAAEAGGQEAATTQEMLQSMSTTTVPADVWIDGEGRMRKMTYALEMNVGGQAFSSDTTVELWDFGVAVDVTPPAEGEIVDLDEVLQGATEGLTDSLDGATEDLEELQRELQEEIENQGGG